MGSNVLFGGICALACATALAGCSGSPVSSASPSAPSAVAPSSASAVGMRSLPLEDPPVDIAPPVGDPAMPASPPVLTINIIGSLGAAAFTPNPVPVAVGDTVVWTNMDALPHNIVLEDGTLVGEVVPGQSTAPVAVSSPSMGFHCTYHPSMFGILGGQATPDGPVAPPYEPPPADPYYGGYYSVRNRGAAK